MRTIAALVLFALLLPGCASSFNKVDTKMEALSADFDIPAKDMMARLKQVLDSPPLSLGVMEQSQGSLLTGYQRFPGDWHIGRRWQEQTRYRITVSPDFNEPAAKSHIEVREMTEQRAAEGMKWENRDSLPRPQRARDVLRQIESQLRGPTTR
jgi:hypothetical protein